MISLTLTLFILLCPAQEGLEQLGVGHFIEVRGELASDGRFVSEKVELLEPDDEILIGSVGPRQSNPARFSLLGQVVETDEETTWSNVDHRIAGKRVKVEGSWKGPRKFTAKKVTNRGEGRDRIGGRIDAWSRVEGGWEARVMIFTVFVPDGTEFEHEEPIASYALAPEHKPGLADDLTDLERDEDDAFGAGFRLTDSLRWTGQLEGKVTHEQDFDLMNNVQGDEEDRTDHEFSARVRLVWTPSPNFWGLIEGRFSERYRRDEDNGIFDGENRHSGGVGEAWLQWRDALGWRGFDITVGRQDFDDPREWIYDENLDAVRLSWLRPDWRLDVSASTLLDGGERNKASDNAIAYLSNNDRKRQLAAWTLFRDIDAFTEDNGNPVTAEHSWYLGARALGEWVPDNEIWFDFAYQLGEREGRDVRAWAYDAGTTWEPSFAEDWYFTIGYALGTGDGSSTGTDGTFRQTGYQDNNGRFGGVTSFRYYGELLDLELSNLGIFTLGVGKILAEKTSLDLVFHNYTQDVPLASFSPGPSIASNLDQQPNGFDAALGNEVDLILGYRALASWDVEIVTALFDPGPGFDENDSAWMAKLQLRYRF